MIVSKDQFAITCEYAKNCRFWNRYDPSQCLKRECKQSCIERAVWETRTILKAFKKDE